MKWLIFALAAAVVGISLFALDREGFRPSRGMPAAPDTIGAIVPEFGADSDGVLAAPIEQPEIELRNDTSIDPSTAVPPQEPIRTAPKWPTVSKMEALKRSFETSPEQSMQWATDFCGEFPAGGILDFDFLSRVVEETRSVPVKLRDQMLQEAQLTLDEHYPYLAASALEVSRAIDSAKSRVWDSRHFRLTHLPSSEVVWQDDSFSDSKAMTYTSSAHTKDWTLNYTVYTNDHPNLKHWLGETTDTRALIRKELTAVVRKYR